MKRLTGWGICGVTNVFKACCLCKCCSDGNTQKNDGSPPSAEEKS